jgi:hypothetical protein
MLTLMQYVLHLNQSFVSVNIHRHKIEDRAPTSPRQKIA